MVLEINRKIDLNPAQSIAVDHVHGPALVLSGAGSGKTRVIVERIISLIQKGIKPYNILALTFTNKAAEEMKERVIQALRIRESLPHLSTFHSFCLKYIRIYGSTDGINNYEITDTYDQKKILKKILTDNDIDIKRLSEFHYQISSIKNNGIFQKEKISEFLSDYLNKEEIITIYEQYQRTLQDQRLMDFDDILIYFYKLLENDEIKTILEDRFQFIMVDEYQDTNRIQYLILLRLASDHRNLFAVGDDDQSIYGFRGACVQNILDFKDDFADTQIIKLEDNYRSKGNILRLANSVIMHNTQRMAKQLKPTRDHGSKTSVFYGDNPFIEAYKICRQIYSLSTEGYRYNDMAILYRTNAQSRELEEALRSNQINYKIIGNVGFYERKEIKDIIAYLRFLINPYDLISLQRIINTPPRRIGEKTFGLISDKFNGIDNLHNIISQQKNNNIKIFFDMFYRIIAFFKKDHEISALVEFILSEIDYYEYLETYYKDFESRIENLESFINSCREFEKNNEGSGLSDFMDNLSLISDQDNLNYTDDNIKLLTVHTAKGLEFPIVFIAGLEENMFPHKRCIYDPEQIEEERRLFYVAVTRAKDRLFLSFSKNRMLYGNSMHSHPSRFLKELPPEEISWDKSNPLLNEIFYKDKMPFIKTQQKEPEKMHPSSASSFKPGQKINHRKFGYGIIQNITDSKPRKKIGVLFFKSNSYKEFILDIFVKHIIN